MLIRIFFKALNKLSADEYANLISGYLRDSLVEIESEILKAANNNKGEAEKIRDAHKFFLDKRKVDEGNADKEFITTFNNQYADFEEPSKEIKCLSFASYSITFAIMLVATAGDIDGALLEIKIANRYLGYYHGLTGANVEYAMERKERAIKAATARHSNGKMVKDQVIDFYLSNKHLTKDSAAQKAITTLKIPFAYRTVRNWLSNIN